MVRLVSGRLDVSKSRTECAQRNFSFLNDDFGHEPFDRRLNRNDHRGRGANLVLLSNSATPEPLRFSWAHPDIRRLRRNRSGIHTAPSLRQTKILVPAPDRQIILDQKPKNYHKERSRRS